MESYPKDGNVETGGPWQEGGPWQDDGGESVADFTEKSLRRGFIKKVFGILAVQLVVTFGMIALFVLVTDVKTFVQSHSWMYIVACVTTIAIIIPLSCFEKLRKQYPQNLICLIVFTLAEGWMLGTVSSYVDSDEVLMACGICAGVSLVMCLFGFQSKIDFTMLVGVLLALTLCLLGFGLLCLIFQSRYMDLMYASIGALVFSLWIAVDVQLVTGKGKYVLDSEEYILAALNIYLDIVNLFLYLMILVKGK